MSATQYSTSKSIFRDSLGQSLALGSVEVTDTFTHQPVTTYKDALLSSMNEHPIPLTAAGKADIYLVDGTYDIVVRDVNGQVVDTVSSHIVITGSAVPPTDTNVPIGGIIMYSGLLSSLAAIWKVCDGTNGTPNLIDKFVVGTATQGNIGTTGGTLAATMPSHTHTATHKHTAEEAAAGSHTHTVAHSHTASSNTVGDHQHPLIGDFVGLNFCDGVHGETLFRSTGERLTGTSGGHSHTITVNSATPTTSSSSSHSHSVTVNETEVVTGSAVSDGDNRPPFYTLAYIMRVS